MNLYSGLLVAICLAGLCLASEENLKKETKAALQTDSVLALLQNGDTASPPGIRQAVDSVPIDGPAKGTPPSGAKTGVVKLKRVKRSWWNIFKWGYRAFKGLRGLARHRRRYG